MNSKTRLPPPVPFDTIPNGAPERHAQALADIRAMHDELNTAHETIGQLRADLHRAEDRVTLLTEERDKYRDEAHLFRSKLIELATQQANIGLLTVKAQEIMRVVNELTTPTHSPALDVLEQTSHAAALNQLAGDNA